MIGVGGVGVAVGFRGPCVHAWEIEGGARLGLAWFVGKHYVSQNSLVTVLLFTCVFFYFFSSLSFVLFPKECSGWPAKTPAPGYCSLRIHHSTDTLLWTCA